MSITIHRTTIPAMTAVSLRGTVPTYSDEGRLWEQLMPAIAAQGIAPIGPCCVIEHNDEYTERDVDLTIFLPVASGTRAEAPLEILELPERECIVAQVQGAYSQIVDAHDLISARVAKDNLTLRSDGTIASHAFNRYLTTPDQVSEDELVTEVCLPLG